MGVRVCQLPMVLAALVLGISVAHAQTLPETCQASPGTPPVELEKRKQALKRDVALKSAAEKPGSPGWTKDLERDLRKSAVRNQALLQARIEQWTHQPLEHLPESAKRLLFVPR